MNKKLTRKEAVNLMGIGYTTLYSWIAQGLPVIREGNRVYFRDEDLKNYKPKKVGRPRSVNK